MNVIEEDEEDESQNFVRFMKALTSAKRPSLCGAASLTLTLVSSIWFVACFTARAAAWWNSSAWFFLFYGVAALLALRGIRSPLGIIALTVVLVPFIGLCLLLLA